MTTNSTRRPVALFRELANHESDANGLFQELAVSANLRFVISRRLADSDAVFSSPPEDCELLLWRDYSGRKTVILRDNSDAISLIEPGGAQKTVTVAARSELAAQAMIDKILQLFPERQLIAEQTLSFSFWRNGKFGPHSFQRTLEVPAWNQISVNYGAKCRQKLAALMVASAASTRNGRLVLWRGESGTGKTFALRALAWEWRNWCRFEYVLDPEEMFQSAHYLASVIMSNDEEDDGRGNRPHMRMLILEDSGELAAIDARMQAGHQSLSRLLNASAGLVGQASNCLFLVSTNEELGKLHPAIVRPGRCMEHVEFARLTRDEAAAWLKINRPEPECEPQSLTLAELYALPAGQAQAGASTR